MAVKEGRCPNCGSLVHLESNAEQGHCLFCDAVFPNAKAFEIAAHPAGFEFPNLPQPKYEGPSLTPRQGSIANLPVNQPTARKKQAAKPEPEPYVRKDIKIPDIKIPARVHLAIGGFVIAVILIFAVITVPLSIRRDKDRAAILAALPSVSPVAIESESNAALRRIDNSYLMVTIGKPVTPEQAVALFKAYCEKRAEIRGITNGTFDQIYGNATLRLAHEGGGYLIDHPNTSSLASGAAIVVLK